MYQDDVSFKKEFEQAKTYWQGKFSSEISNISLPCDFERSLAYKREEYKIQFDQELSGKLLSLSRNQDVLLYIVLLAALDVLVFKYTNKSDVSIGAPIYIDDDHLYRERAKKLIVFRDILDNQMTFKELLIRVKQTVIDGYDNQYYVVEDILDTLGVNIPDDLSLSRIILLLTDIHKKEIVSEIVNSSANDVTISIAKNQDTLTLEGNINYNSKLLTGDTTRKITGHYLAVLEQVMSNINIKLGDIELLSEDEKKQVLVDFNDTKVEYPGDKLIHRLFEEQAERTPENIAVSVTVDISDIYRELTSETHPTRDGNVIFDIKRFKILETCCFKKKPYLFQVDIDIPGKEKKENLTLTLLKTPQHDNVVVNQNVLALLDCFDGERNLKSIFSLFHQMNLEFLVQTISMDDILEISYGFSRKTHRYFSNSGENFVPLLKLLYSMNLIELGGLNEQERSLEPDLLKRFREGKYTDTDMNLEEFLFKNENIEPADVLLLGDTPGMASSGILYLGAYLMRNGVAVKCQFYDSNQKQESIKTNLFELLEKIKPRVVGISMKWYPHISRVFEICQIIKMFSPDTIVVLGGNSASYFHQEVIKNENVDYVIRGDGELPLFKICRGDEAIHIPNCTYKKNTDGEIEIIENPCTYIQDETNGSEIYLSHLDDILLSKYTSIFGTFYIQCQKGCGMNCFYCPACREGQKKTFNRDKPYRRDARQVREDIIEAKKYTSIFSFEMDAPGKILYEYTKEILDGIDLTQHYCLYSGNYIPPVEVIELVNKSFKYVYWNYDFASLSQRHREQLFSLGLAKPSPTDDEIVKSIEEIQKYENCEVVLNTVLGLPYFRPGDIEASETFVDRLLNDFTCITELHWARLQAQPGAPIVENVETYDMYTHAAAYGDYLKYSESNLANPVYPTLENLNYPYIYYNEEDYNTKITKLYVALTAKLKKYLERIKEKLNLQETLSYRELNEQANQLARQLKARGVGKDCIVGLMLEEGLDISVSMLAVLKAGGAYLPMDPTNPTERKKYIMENSNASLFIVQKRIYDNNKDVWESISPGNVVVVDDKTPYSIDDNGSDFDTPIDPGDLAYVIYTSGTTSKPKGVLVQQGGLANYAAWRRDFYEYTAKDVTFQVLSYSFDGFGSNFYASLVSGGTLCMLPYSRRLDIDSMIRAIKRNKVTNMALVPGAYEALLDHAGKGDLGSLRFVVLAGEKSGPGLIKKSRGKASNALLFNEYGPTEATVTATGRSGLDELTAAVIGKPIYNTHIYVLDPSLKPVPVRVAGELCIGGRGVARGYLNNPELTEQAFRGAVVSHSSSVIRSFKSSESTDDQCPMTNDRLYRTGDLARWLPHGEIEFLGRIDRQVKVRGNRIEPGEIENKLRMHERIKDAVVLAKENEEGNKYLCAYIVTAGASDSDNLNVSMFRDYLSKDLPEYMIPAYFVQVSEVPLTPNGKVDRKALEAYDTKSSAMGTGVEYVAPGNEMEKEIADIWMEVLKLDQVGINDLIFELGGNSLNIIQINDKLKRVLEMDIPVVIMFEYPTIRSLAAYLNQVKKKHHPDADLPATVSERSQALEQGKKDRMKRLQKKRGLKNE